MTRVQLFEEGLKASEGVSKGKSSCQRLALFSHQSGLVFFLAYVDTYEHTAHGIAPPKERIRAGSLASVTHILVG